MFDEGNWRNHLLLSRVSWGEERIKAAKRALLLRPDLALGVLAAGDRAYCTRST
jgi:hypothetical protein